MKTKNCQEAYFLLLGLSGFFIFVFCLGFLGRGMVVVALVCLLGGL